MKKIKLIIFHPYSDLGGADNSLKRLIEKLDTKLISISFISLNNSILKKEFKKKIQFIKINTSRTLYSLIKLRKIVKKIKYKNKYSKIIFFSNQNFANIISYFALFNLKKIKKIFVDRNHLDELNFYNSFYEKIKKIIIKFFIKILYNKADLVIGISHKLSNDLSKFINGKVKTIYSPAFDKSILNKASKKINLDKRFKYIINVSRFTKRKDHYTTLMAFKIASLKIKKLKLILIGYGPEYKNILTLIKKLNLLNKTIIINKILNPYPYIKKSNLLILTSKYEGMGNILVEAITLNKPVISTNCNAGPSEILLNGKGGELVRIGDFNHLAKKIIKHFQNEKILKNKIKFAKSKLDRFNINKHAKIYTKIFQKI